MPKQKIHCSINNCHYWQQGNLCDAEEILITSGTMAKSLSADIDAPMGSQIAQTPVGTGAESCCKTFALKSTYPAFEDGVKQAKS